MKIDLRGFFSDSMSFFLFFKIVFIPLLQFLRTEGNQCFKKNVTMVVWASLVAQMVENLSAIQEAQVQSLAQKDPRRRE